MYDGLKIGLNLSLLWCRHKLSRSIIMGILFVTRSQRLGFDGIGDISVVFKKNNRACNPLNAPPPPIAGRNSNIYHYFGPFTM